MQMRPGEPLTSVPASRESVFFPSGCVISVLYRSGRTLVDAYGVGCEGMVGARGSFRLVPPRYSLVCQIGGELLSLPRSVFEKHAASDRSLGAAVQAFEHGALNGILQCAVCNARHSIAHRTARSLLLSSDRAGRESFRLTHELLARMLGAGRAGVSRAVEVLQARKAVATRAGRITILDRRALERLSCDCY